MARLADNLIHYWELDEASGDASDEVGAITLTNTSATYSTGKINNAAYFNTSAKLQGTVTTGISSSFTISAWVYITTTGITHCIVNSNVSSYSNYWVYFYINGTQKLAFDMYDGTNNPNIASTSALSTNTWYHVAAVRDVAADKMRIYINGTSAATEITDTTTSVPVYSDFAVGRRANNTDGTNGRIDELGVWSRALSASEINALYNAGSGVSYTAITATPTFKSATVNAASVPATQTNFPSYVDLSRLGITTLAEAQSVRVYADSGKTTEWAREIVSATEMHVKVPSMTSTTTMYVEWDGVSPDYAVTDTYGRNAVWTGYNAVYHFETKTLDSTGNGYTLTETGTVTQTSALVGNGISYTTSASNRLTTSSQIGLTQSSERTMSGWIKWASETSVDRDIMTMTHPTSGATYRILYEYNGGTRRIRAYRSGSSALFLDSNGNRANNTWLQFAMTYSGTTLALYLNGASITSGSNSGTKTVSEATGLEIGIFNGSYAPTNGIMDEYRVANNPKSANWLTTEYNNQSDEATFWGTWSTVGGSSFTPTPQMHLMQMAGGII